jgi:hypothetical protein
MSRKRLSFGAITSRLMGHSSMIKPIAFRDIGKKRMLKGDVFSKLAHEKRNAISQEFIDRFSSLKDPVDATSIHQIP